MTSTSSALKNILSAVTVCFIAGCSHAESDSNNHPAFCEIRRTPIENEKVYYDLDLKKAYVASGTKYNADLTFISTEDYLGFIAPMHLIVPAPKALESGRTLSWTTHGYNFTVEQAPEQGAGWYLVRSRIISEPDNTDVTTGPKIGKRAQWSWHIGADVLFSVESGIIAYQDISHVSGEEFYTGYYLCSEAKMDLYDLVSSE